MTSHPKLPFQEYGKRICPHWSIRSRQEAKSTRRKSLDGDKMKIDHFDVLLSNQSDKPYIGGETVQGQIEISVCKKVQIARLSVKLLGQVQTSWRNKNSEQVYESNEQVLNEYVDLTRVIADHCDENFYLTEGLHNICFQIPLPLDVISSIEKENYGWVRYTCIATLEIPENGASELIAERNFSVVSMLNLDAPYMRQPTSSREESEVMGCCCRRKIGVISAQMTVADMGLLPGETVKITLTVENNVKKKHSKKHRDIAHECVLISLCQQLDFVSQNRYELHLYDRKSLTIAVESHGTCKATPGSGPETKYIDFTVPRGLQPTSTKANGLITISYFFKLDMETFDVIVPVIVGSVKTPGPV
uniref:Arrestin C-terminal-like domain-containing protein n=2 Tax=Ascaris TaxID=6251 RepID=A0A9J2NZC1_ASCLU